MSDERCPHCGRSDDDLVRARMEGWEAYENTITGAAQKLGVEAGKLRNEILRSFLPRKRCGARCHLPRPARVRCQLEQGHGGLHRWKRPWWWPLMFRLRPHRSAWRNVDAKGNP